MRKNKGSCRRRRNCRWRRINRRDRAKISWKGARRAIWSLVFSILATSKSSKRMLRKRLKLRDSYRVMWRRHFKIMGECRGSVSLYLKMLPQMKRTPFKRTPKSSILARNRARTSPQLMRNMTCSAKKFRWFPKWAQEEAEKCGHFSLRL